MCRDVSSTNSVNAMKVFVLILASCFDRVCVHHMEVQFWVKLNCLAQATNGICVGAYTVLIKLPQEGPIHSTPACAHRPSNSSQNYRLF